MSIQTEMMLVASRKGRIIMHALALAKDHKLCWHALGIWREVTSRGAANPFATVHA